MRAVVRTTLAACVACAIASAQAALIPDNGGNGSDGALVVAPGQLITMTTVFQSRYQFTSVNIGAGATVIVTGPSPLVWCVQGPVAINGWLKLDGAVGGLGQNNANGGVGGTAGAGGGTGGTGGTGFTGAGQPGGGRSPGQPGTDGGFVGGPYTDPVGGGGGGGNATSGLSGGLPNGGALPSASGAGGSVVVVPRGGAGGGGGGNDLDSPSTASLNDGGGGGGGGGGDLAIYGNTTISIGGQVSARGGTGGNNTGNGGAGGGGAGGCIDLVAPSITITGSLNAQGGAAGIATQTNCGCSSGGAGGDGRIVLCANALSVQGAIVPAPAVSAQVLVIRPEIPIGRFHAIATTPASYFVVLLSVATLQQPIPTQYNSLAVDPSDALFTATFPVNSEPWIFGGLAGLGSGTPTIDLGYVGLPTWFEVTATAQLASVTQGAALDGLTAPVPIRIRF